MKFTFLQFLFIKIAIFKWRSELIHLCHANNQDQPTSPWTQISAPNSSRATKTTSNSSSQTFRPSSRRCKIKMAKRGRPLSEPPNGLSRRQRRLYAPPALALLLIPAIDRSDGDGGHEHTQSTALESICSSPGAQGDSREVKDLGGSYPSRGMGVMAEKSR